MEDMNWTGGRLQRHSSNSTNGVVAKQKQHFAKVRARLQTGENSQNNLQFQPNFLPSEVPALAARLMPLKQYHQDRVEHTKGRYTAQGKDEFTVSLAYHLLMRKCQFLEKLKQNQDHTLTSNSRLQAFPIVALGEIQRRVAALRHDIPGVK